MKLVPAIPPGRATRKARAYEAEIVQLRQSGYTYEAIRAALAQVGVDVTISTVRREATRAAATPRLRHPLNVAKDALRVPASPATSAASLPAARIAVGSPQERRSGRDVAETFMRSQITNSLIRSKEQR
jgi:hypothetical protein